MALIHSLLKATVLIGSTSFGTTHARQQGRFPQDTLPGEAARHGDDPHFRPSQGARPGEAARHGSWADVARQAAEWWTRSQRHAASPDQSLSNLQRAPDAVGPEATQFQLSLGESPMGTSPWSCDKALVLEDTPTCTEAQQAFYSRFPGMHAEPRLRELQDTALYVAASPDKRAYPCRNGQKGLHGLHPIEVVVDGQFSNQPSCCPLEYLYDETSANLFKGLAGQVYPVPGSNLSYSVLEPMHGVCSKFHPCPVVVELAGVDRVPWMLLQGWCMDCMSSLGSVVVSMTGVVSYTHVEAQLVTVIKGFLNSRNNVDLTRVYLVCTQSGSEAGFLAALKDPDLFAFAMFAGKFRITEDIAAAAANVTSEMTRLRMISFHIGSGDLHFNHEQDFWSKLTDVVKPLALPVVTELRYYPGGPTAVWYAGWNAYHELLWTGKKRINEYIKKIPLTCAPRTAVFVDDYRWKVEQKLKKKVVNSAQSELREQLPRLR